MRACEGKAGQSRCSAAAIQTFRAASLAFDEDEFAEDIDMGLSRPTSGESEFHGGRSDVRLHAKTTQHIETAEETRGEGRKHTINHIDPRKRLSLGHGDVRLDPARALPGDED